MFNHFNYLKVVLLFIFFIQHINTKAQAPGEVSSNLGLWLRASDFPLGSTTAPYTLGTAPWDDARSNNSQASFHPSTPGTSKYAIVQEINFNNSIRINDEWFDAPVDINQPNVNIFMVYKPINSGNNRELWGNGTNSFTGKQAFVNKVHDGNGFSNYPAAGTNGETYLNHVNSIDNSSSAVYINGNTVTTYPTGITVGSAGSSFLIGRVHSQGPPPPLSSNALGIGEIIVYTGSITQQERERINSYLAIKHGITLSHDYSINNGTTNVWDRTLNTSYNHNIVGIAKASGSGLDISKSKSQHGNALVTLSTTGTILDNEALLIGNNNAATNNSTNFDLNGNFFVKGKRMNRVWKCQKTTGFLSTTDIGINNTINLPSNFKSGNLVLLVADDNNFSMNLTAYPLNNNHTTGNYEASNVVLGNGQFFTIAYMDVALWVKADANLNTTTQGMPYEYYDNILGINSLSSPSTANNPTHVIGTNPNSINFNPYIKFNDTSLDQYIKKSNFTAFGNTNASTFLVLRRDNNNLNNNIEGILSYAVGTQQNGNEFVISTPSNMTVSIQEPNLINGTKDNQDITDNIPHIFSNRTNATTNENEIRLDAIGTNKAYSNAAATINSKGTLVLGQEQDNLGGGFSTNQAYEGDIAEVIVFNKRITGAHRNGIETYLAIKYGITLSSHYRLTDNTILWNINTNSTYHYNVAGIGREEIFALDQRKSTSQNAAVDVTIEHSGALPNNSYLIWGCNTSDYDMINTSNAPIGYQTSDKIWKVQNFNNQVGPVDITLRIPPSATSIPINKLKLVVNNTDNFSNASNFNSGTANTTGFITFTGITLQNGDFFSLAIEDSPTSVSFLNNENTNAPTSFEACVGTMVQFTYSNLSSNPDVLELKDDMGAPLAIPLVQGQNLILSSGNGSSGTITITIPPNAATGNVRLINTNLSGSGVVYNFNNNLIIHKPSVDFYLPLGPICATDTTPIIGIPIGGTFSTIPMIPNLIDNNKLIGLNAGWNTNLNDSIKEVTIQYTHTPLYVSGSTCSTPIIDSQTITIRDNRLTILDFEPIITSGTIPSPNDRVILNINTPIVQRERPDLNHRYYPINFSGNYVNNVGGVDSFFTDYAGFGTHSINMEYDNGGCIGQITSDIEVLFPLQLSGLEDTLCNQAPPINFTRDTTLAAYKYTIDSAFTPSTINSNIVILEIIESNIISSVSTQDPAYSTAITPINLAYNNETYELNPQAPVLLNVGAITIQMDYIASRRVVQHIDTTTNTIIFTQTRVGTPSSIEYPITLVGRPQLGFSLDPSYCKSAATSSLAPIPAFKSPYSRFDYRFSYFPTGPFSPYDSLARDTFDANYIYDQSVPFGAQNRDIYVEVVYTVRQYGCVDTHTDTTRIIRPIASRLFLNPPPIITGYCNNATPIELIPSNTITNASGIGEYLVNDTLSTNTNLINAANFFIPSNAQDGDYDISYRFTDTTTNCVSTSAVTVISIRRPAEVELQIDGNNNTINPRICANTDSVLLKTILISGSSPSSLSYNSTNFVITDSILRPDSTYNINGVSGSITRTITVNYTDSFSCATSDDLLVEIYKPLPTMNGFTNSNSNGIFTYCNNENPFPIIETPSRSMGDIVTGLGVVDNNGVYLYNPSLVTVDSFILDTVQYAYTDADGCAATTETIVRIDSIPSVQLNGLDSIYCVNNVSVQLSGNSSTGGSSVYIGPGMSPQGLFDPSTAGIGLKNIIYTFTDGNGCKNSALGSTTIHPLPVPQFLSTRTQYCSSDSLDTLTRSTPMGMYTFWGNIIDSTHILNPQNTTGQQTVFYSLTDSLGCVDTSSTTIIINPLPVITVSGLDSAYCFNSSIDNILISPFSIPNPSNANSAGFVPTATGVTFDPSNDSIGNKSYTYTYTNNVTNCSNTIVLNTTVYDVPSLSYTGIDSVYCAVDSLYTINGFPTGGVFSGAGISNSGTQYYFNPIITGGGIRTLNYRIDTGILYNSSDTLHCVVEVDIPVVVNQLPNLDFYGPGDNYRFCSNETDTLLTGVEPTPTWRLFTSTTSGAIDTATFQRFVPNPNIPGNFISIRDTFYYFSPNNAGEGIHQITYTATDSLSGCQDSLLLNYYVTDFGNGASFLLDSAYCASNDSIFLNGIPTGGFFLRNQDTLHLPYLTLNTPISITDTIIYNVQYDACMDSDTQIVSIDSLIDLSFIGSKPSKTYCLGDEDSQLFPNISGGTFNGNAVISGDSLFSLQYANTGDNIITYTYKDSTTNCESTITDTFFVFGMPNTSFDVVGGCQYDSIFFYPDNLILGLNNTFGSRIIDSITAILWELEPGIQFNGNNNTNNEIDSISHIFNTPGVYETKLYVANRTYCVDTSIVRIVISPTINSTQFPYDETFENSDGEWYAEAKDSTHSLLWEWGIDSLNMGINDPNNKIWITQANDQYAANEAAWVYSPCFDISTLERPMIRFDYWSDSRIRGDGTVLEFQNSDGSWSPLGELDRGINWFDTDFIAGSPGNQTLSPIGWSGQEKKWINGRYKLDAFKNTNNSKLRLRMAFGSSSINLGSFHNGFAFDNVWIGNRTRNVLLETTSNIYESNMDYINNYVYQLVFHSNVNKDVVLLQYHSAAPNNNDLFHSFDPITPNARTLFYGIPFAGTAFIDGTNNTKSKWLNDVSFEQDMLESPKFEVEIDTFYYNNPGMFRMTTTVTALVDIPDVKRYRINMIITEDSLSYPNGEQVHAVVRKDYTSNMINTFDKSWTIGESITLTHDYPATDLNFVPNHFQAVAFIQAQTTGATEVFQTATTRDVSGYWLGVNPIASEKELHEIKDMNLYPNPAQDIINIDFPNVLKKDYKWKLLNISGIIVKEDVLQAGEQSLQIRDYDLPSGVYIFMVYNDNVYSQRKVIINQD